MEPYHRGNSLCKKEKRILWNGIENLQPVCLPNLYLCDFLLLLRLKRIMKHFTKLWYFWKFRKSVNSCIYKIARHLRKNELALISRLNHHFVGNRFRHYLKYPRRPTRGRFNKIFEYDQSSPVSVSLLGVADICIIQDIAYLRKNLHISSLGKSISTLCYATF